MPIKEALKIARDAEMDLVEVSPGATPPVCRVMDFGKFIYEKTKKEREAKKAQTKIEVKEIKESAEIVGIKATYDLKLQTKLYKGDPPNTLPASVPSQALKQVIDVVLTDGTSGFGC